MIECDPFFLLHYDYDFSLQERMYMYVQVKSVQSKNIQQAPPYVISTITSDACWRPLCFLNSLPSLSPSALGKPNNQLFEWRPGKTNNLQMAEETIIIRLHSTHHFEKWQILDSGSLSWVYSAIESVIAAQVDISALAFSRLAWLKIAVKLQCHSLQHTLQAILCTLGMYSCS